MVDHVLQALTALGDTPPKCFDLASHTARMEALAAMVAKHKTERP
jgi:hypothetical protein